MHHCKCLPTQKCILREHAHALVAHGVPTARAPMEKTVTHMRSPVYGFLKDEYVIMSTVLYEGHLYSESLDLCMWEAVCCARGGGSRVNTALSKYTEITAQSRQPIDTETKPFSSAGFSKSCWRNIFTLIYIFSKVSPI